jgi:hypothetical protein
VVILLVLKVLLLISQRPASIWLEVQLWQLDFVDNFFDMGYILGITLIVVIWLLTGYFASVLDEMSLDEALIKYELATVAPVEGPPARERLLGIVFGLGFILVVLTALLRLNLRMLFAGELSEPTLQPLPYLAAGAWNVLLYFLLGLVLMSQTQFARLNARWRFQNIKVAPKLAGTWAFYSVIFILLLSIVSSLLPTSYSLGFLSVIAYVLELVVGIIIFVFGFLFSIMIFLFNLLTSLLGVNPQTEESLPAIEYAPPTLPEEVMTTGAIPWLEVVKSLLFWGVLICVVGYSLYHFVRQHEGILKMARRFPGLTWLVRAWQWLRGGFRGFNRKISDVLDSGMQRLRARRERRITRAVGRFINLRRLNPRQRVFFFFLAMIRRGGERGLSRKEAQTPLEYAATLERAIPEVDDDVASLTDSFIEARCQTLLGTN